MDLSLNKLVFVLILVLISGCAEVQEELIVEDMEETQIEQEVIEEEITAEELAKHNSEGDCWIVYEGKVYDFSNAKMHPNMAETFYAHCGQLSGFEEGAKARHTESGEERVSSYGEYLGELI
ncbi:hypothetical protein KY345_03570 [Candidatus Woesearchaeota archaeon]|nr:hypothetical protein [Candidatus Woesearchaeota archaeon]